MNKSVCHRGPMDKASASYVDSLQSVSSESELAGDCGFESRRWFKWFSHKSDMVIKPCLKVMESYLQDTPDSVCVLCR